MRVELSILNATDRNNACCVDEVQFEAAPDGQIYGHTSYDNWLGITPLFSLVWEF